MDRRERERVCVCVCVCDGMKTSVRVGIMVSNHYNFSNIILICGYELNAKTMDHTFISFVLFSILECVLVRDKCVEVVFSNSV